MNRHIKWKCRCDCGTITEVYTSNLVSGNSTSCGCKQKVRDNYNQKRRTMYARSKDKRVTIRAERDL